MSTSRSADSLPPHPNVERQRKRAKSLLKAARSGDADAIARFARFNLSASDTRRHPDAAPDAAGFRLSHAQLVIAREYGFASWTRLIRAIESRSPTSYDADVRLMPLREALQSGDATRLEKLLATDSVARRSINRPVMAMETPPIVFARHDRPMVDVLLRHGADINAHGQFWGRAAGVLEGVSQEQRDYLISRGATPAVDELAQAISAGDVSRVRELLSHDPSLRAHVNRPLFPFGGRPVNQARNNPAMLDVLLEHGADINARSDWWAGGFGVLDGIDLKAAEQLIARGARVDVFAAAQFAMFDRLAEMLRHQPELVHARGGDGQCPLHVASTREVIDLLLDHGAEMDVRCVDHLSTAAQYAVDHAPWKTRYLIERGAAPDVFMAAALGDVGLLRQVLDQDPESVTACIGRDGYPPVPVGAGGTIYHWKLRGARRPHEAATRFGHRDAYELLWSRTPEHTQFVINASGGDLDAVRACAAQHSDWLEHLDSHDRTLLADAAWSFDFARVKTLLDIGFPVDEAGCGEGTALDRAVVRGFVKIADLLLERGARTDIQNRYGGDPMGACLWGSRFFRDRRGDYPATIARLEQAGMKRP